jgi:tRNA(His) 5'-end guanylyltransferase
MIVLVSDEISMIFPNGINMFDGRIQKIISIAAGYTSTRFN